MAASFAKQAEAVKAFQQPRFTWESNIWSV